MPRLSDTSTPKYRKHASDQARVTFIRRNLPHQESHLEDGCLTARVIFRRMLEYRRGQPFLLITIRLDPKHIPEQNRNDDWSVVKVNGSAQSTSS